MSNSTSKKTTVTSYEGLSYLTWYSEDPERIVEMEQLLKDYPDKVELISKDESSMKIHVPKEWFDSPYPDKEDYC